VDPLRCKPRDLLVLSENFSLWAPNLLAAMMLRSTASLLQSTSALLSPPPPSDTAVIYQGKSYPLDRNLARTTVTLPTDPAERIDLPDASLWRSYFSPFHVKHRISVSNPRTAASLAKAFRA
jgi:hypothetical protein